MPEKKERPKLEFPTNIPQTIVLGEQFFKKEHPEYGWSFGWNLTQDGEEKVMFVKEALNIKLQPYSKGSKLQIIYAEKKNDSGKPYHEWQVSPQNGTQPTQPAFTAIAHPPIAQRNGTEWFGAHLVACAQLAVKVADQLGIKSDDARQACFATLCIDAQRRDVILDGQEPPKPVQSSPAATQPQLSAGDAPWGHPNDHALPAQRAAISRLCEKLRVGVLPILNDVGCVDELELTKEQAGNAIELLNKRIDAL